MQIERLLRRWGEDFVWVHDYHLMGVGAQMRALGNRSRPGFILQIPLPSPSPDIFRKLPWRLPAVESLRRYDLVGIQAARDRRNFLACPKALAPEAAIRGRGCARSRSCCGSTGPITAPRTSRW